MWGRVRGRARRVSRGMVAEPEREPEHFLMLFSLTHHVFFAAKAA